MPILPEELFLEAVDQLVSIDRDWIPDGDGSLYLRPFMFANEIFLGRQAVVGLPVHRHRLVGRRVLQDRCPGGFASGSRRTTRARAPGGTGAAKCGGNYAASLLAQAEATRHGCDQVVFLDAVEQRWVEELGGMNIFFVFDDGSMVTPPLGGTILPGITRSSLLTLAKDKGITVREERYSIDQWRADAASGRLREAFACGTAAVVTPIGTVRAPGWRVQDRQRRPRHQDRGIESGAGRHPARPRGRPAQLDLTRSSTRAA